MRSWILLGVALVAGCGGSSANAMRGGRGAGGMGGSSGGGGHDAAFDERAWNGDGSTNEGAIHVAWVLETADGSPTDCIASMTRNVALTFTNAAHLQVFWQVNYCVDMQETVGGFAPGDYSIQLSLDGTTDGGGVAFATGTASVTAGRVAEAGTLILKLAGP